MFESFDDFLNEKRSIAKVHKEYTKVVNDMAELVTNWKAAKESGDEKAQANFLAMLKELTAKKKALISELDDAVGLKDVDAELAEANDFNDPILIKMRAAQMKANKKAAEKAEKSKKELSPAKLKKIQALKDERAEVLRDMEQEGELEGGEIADMYGDMLNNIDQQIIKLGGNPLEESYDGNMSDFKYEFPIKFEDVTGNPEKAIKRISKKGKGYEVRTSTYMSEPEMEEVGDAMGLILVSYEKHSNIAITVYESATNESKVQLKRKYTESYPAVTAGKFAKVRNKMLEAIGDGKITQEEFDAILKELSSDSKRWSKINNKYFNVSEDGISLSTFGKRALKQITVNENMDKFIFESFSDFVNAQNAEVINEGTRGQFGKIYKNGEIRSVYTHYDSYPEHMLPIIKKVYKKGNVDDIISKGDNSGLEASIDKMNFYGDPNAMNPMKGKKSNIDSYIKLAANDGGAEFIYLYDESDKKWYMVDVYGDKELVPAFESMTNLYGETLFEAEVEMDAMDPDNKDFLKFLKKNKVKITDKIMSGPGGGTPVITMQGKRKDLEKVLADCDYGWCDEDLAEYIEESIQIPGSSEMINEAFKSSKLRNLVNMEQSGEDRYGLKSSKLAQAIYGFSKIKLDEIEDADLLDLRPSDAYKTASKDNGAIVFYIVDNEKENPYADKNSYRKPMLRPGILAVSRGKDFLGVTYDSRGSRRGKVGNIDAYTMSSKADAIGGNKDYRGYDASGIYNIKRAADLADRAIVFYINNAEKSSRDLIQQRADAQSGAIAFKSDVDFKKANMTRYKDILANKASKLPIDKIIEVAIEDLSKQIKDGLAKGEKGRYGDIIIGRNKKGNEVRLRDASNHMSNILDDYNRYVDYVAQAEAEDGQDYSSGYYKKQSKEYAKSISDKAKKIKSFDYAW